MAFDHATTVVPTSIGGIEVTLYAAGDIQTASYRVEILDQTGSEMRVRGDIGDLVPHLTQEDITWLLDFIARLRAKATAEFLG